MTTTTNPFPNVALPSGAADADVWADVETGKAFRCFYGPSRRVQHDRGDTFTDVLIQGTQLPDGSVEDRGIDVYIGTDIPLTSNEVRAIASAMMAAADEHRRVGGAMTKSKYAQKGEAQDALWAHIPLPEGSDTTCYRDLFWWEGHDSETTVAIGGNQFSDGASRTPDHGLLRQQRQRAKLSRRRFAARLLEAADRLDAIDDAEVTDR